MGGGETELLELQEENARLRSSITELESQLQQSESTKLQLKKSYEEALQTLADSEAKRETVDKELRLAHDQISSMWKELESLRKQVEGGSTHEAEPIPLAQINEHHGGMENGRMGSTSSNNSIINESFLELQCTLCKEKINKSVSSLHTITSESTQCTCSHSTTNLAGTNHPDRNERARSLGAEQRFQVTRNGNGTQTQAQAQTKPSPKGSPKMQQRSRRGSWLFGRKQQQRVQDLEAHSKVCSSHSNTKPAPSNSHTPSPKLMKKSTSSPSTSRPHSRSNSPLKKSSPRNSAAIMEEYLVINVTRSSHGATDLTPFKVVTKTNLPSFSQSITEVYRSQGDFQWLYEALQEACPERIIPPLKPPISLDATMSEFQRFLSRISTHKILRKQHHFIVFLTGTAEELRSLRAKHRPRRRGDKIQYKPAVGRDTNTGTLVATKDYLTTLEQNINGLVSHLEQSVRRKAGADRTGHWFRAISESEPDVTYLKTAAADLSRTCEATECQHSDSDETLFIHNLQSVADFVRAAQDLLTRVEEAVDRFLYWDEEISIIEAVTNSPMAENTPAENSEDVVFDDSGVSDVTGSSNRSNSDGHTQTGSHVTSQDSASNISEEGISMGEKWAQASKHCADAKDYLEMMCRDMTEELAHFDLQKEKELKQVLLEYTAAQLERHEKFRGKWFAMKFLLDTPISPDKRAIQFSNASSSMEDAAAGDSAEQIAEGTRDSH